METLKRFSGWLYKVSTGWVALAGLIIFLLFTAFILPAQAASANLVSEDVGSPDMSFFYTPSELYKMADAYGEQGRAVYIRARFTFDLIWPLVYTLFLSTTISWAFQGAFRSENRWRWLNIAPILGMVLDYAENISTSLVMYRYPASTNILAVLAPVFTTVKWLLVAGSFIFLLIGATIVVWQFFRKRLGDKT